MMAKNVNESILRKELIEIYEKFLENSHNEVNRNRMVELSGEYNQLTGHGFVIDSVEKAIDGLTMIWQYGKGTLEDNKLKEFSLDILAKLKEDK